MFLCFSSPSAFQHQSNRTRVSKLQMAIEYLRSTNFGSSEGPGPATGFMFGLNSMARQMRSSIESCCKNILNNNDHACWSEPVLTSIIVLFFCSCWEPAFARDFTLSRKLSRIENCIKVKHNMYDIETLFYTCLPFHCPWI